MKKIFLILFLFSALSCKASPTAEVKSSEQPGPVSSDIPFAKGADISWVTEMESKGFKFYNAQGQERECTALMAELGMNAVRLRVWVNPIDGWCGKEDVLVKAKRAKSLGMRILLDFHYSDSWADPQKQPVPSAWKTYSVDQMVQAISKHTEEVLEYLKDNGIDITWVQVGNELENGMLWESGRVSGENATNFARYFGAGREIVRRIYPNAVVMLHISNAWKTETLTWFYDLMRENGVQYDMIGLSLYPSYWENGGYPDWRPKTEQAVKNFSMLHERYGKEVMLVELGMPALQPEQSRDCFQYLFDGTRNYDWFKGIMLWEPEAEHSRNNYDYGCFVDGRPTVALDPFKNQ